MVSLWPYMAIAVLAGLLLFSTMLFWLIRWLGKRKPYGAFVRWCPIRPVPSGGKPSGPQIKPRRISGHTGHQTLFNVSITPALLKVPLKVSRKVSRKISPKISPKISRKISPKTAHSSGPPPWVGGPFSFRDAISETDGMKGQSSPDYSK